MSVVAAYWLAINQVRGGGLVVSILAFHSNDPSFNPAKIIFYVKRRKLIKKRPGLAHNKRNKVLVKLLYSRVIA